MLDQIVLPKPSSHKGENGRVMVIGGSHLFHGASFWAVKVLTRLTDMVFFASVPEVESIVNSLKANLWDFIYISRDKIPEYINEADVVLIGLGMTRGGKAKTPDGRLDWTDTYQVCQYLIKKYPNKKWLIDAGGLQVIPAEWLSLLSQVIITPHQREFETLFKTKLPQNIEEKKLLVSQLAKKYQITILLKGPVDIISNGQETTTNKTGNQGMTKGGTGDVLAGLVAGLWIKNPAFKACLWAAYTNGLAGDELYRQMGPFFNASDLANQLSKTLWHEIQKNK